MFTNSRVAREFNLLDFSLLFCITLVLGSGLTISSSFGAKWFLLTVMGYMALGVGILFKDIRLFGVWLLTSCVPIGVQYKLFSQSGQQFFLNHFGGAPDEPIVNLVDLPIMFLYILWIIDLGISKRKMPSWTRFDTWIAVFLILSLISAYNTTEHLLLVSEAVRYLKYYILYWILRTYITTPLFVWGIIVVSLLVLGLQGIVAMAQYFLYFTLPLTIGGVRESHFQMVAGTVIQRVSGVLGHTNTFAAYLSIVAPAALILIFSKIPMWYRTLAVPFFSLGALALVLTFSRNGWLAFVLCCGIVIWFAMLHQRLSKMLVISIIVVSIFLAGIIFGFGLDKTISEMLGSRSSLLSLDVVNAAIARIFDDDGKAYDSRWDLLGVALEMIKEYPLFGIGLNSFEENMTMYDKTGITNVIQQPVHNVYMLIAAETGIFSLMAFLAVGVALIKNSYTLTKREDELSLIIGVLGLVTFIGLGFSNMFDVTLKKEPIIGMAVVVAALVISMSSGAVEKK